MQPGAYALAKGSDDSLLELRLTPLDPNAALPEDQHSLQCDIDQVRTTLQQLDRRGHNVCQYARALYSIAEVGLTGGAAQTDIAARSLEQLKAEMVENDGQYAKNRHAQILGRFAALNAAVAFCLYLPIKHAYSAQASSETLWKTSFFATLGMTPGDLLVYRSFTFAWAGAMAGTWISYLWRNTQIGFGDLNRSRPSWLAAQIRLLFTGIQSMVVGLFVYFDVVAFRLGGFNTSDFYRDSLVALLVGVLCGCSEKLLPMIIAGKAEEFAKAVGKADLDGATKEAEAKGGIFNKTRMGLARFIAPGPLVTKREAESGQCGVNTEQKGQDKQKGQAVKKQ